MSASLVSVLEHFPLHTPQKTSGELKQLNLRCIRSLEKRKKNHTSIIKVDDKEPPSTDTECDISTLFSEMSLQPLKLSRAMSKLGERIQYWSSKGNINSKNQKIVKELSGQILSSPNEFGVRLVHPYVLYNYQKECISWMKDIENGMSKHSFYKKTCGGLLGVEMGLGKTLMMINLIMSSIKRQRRQKSPTLLVVPKSLMGTVRYEFSKFVAGQLDVAMYHRDILKTKFGTYGAEDLAKHDVIITNYATVQTRHCLVHKDVEKMSTSQKNELKGAQDFVSFPFYRIILDESHEIRNLTTKTTQACLSLNSTRKFTMTGTPIIESEKDLYGQMLFTGLCMPNDEDMNTDNLVKFDVVSRIRYITKEDVDEVKLPELTMQPIYFDMNMNERMAHDDFANKAKYHWNMSKQTVGKESKEFFKKACLWVNKALGICTDPRHLRTKLEDEDASMIQQTPNEVYHTPNESQNESPNESQNESPIEATASFASSLQWIHPDYVSSKMNACVSQIQRIIHENELLRHEDEKKNCPQKYVKMMVCANGIDELNHLYEHCKTCIENFEKKTALVHSKIGNTNKVEKELSRFREDPNCCFLFITIKIGNRGLNLTQAREMMFLSTPQSHAPMLQMISRIHRIGQNHKVSIWFPVAKNSLEVAMFQYIMEHKPKENVRVACGSSTSKLSTDVLHFMFQKVNGSSF
jgi:superfamily II DNA or RNA helicase